MSLLRTWNKFQRFSRANSARGFMMIASGSALAIAAAAVHPSTASRQQQNDIGSIGGAAIRFIRSVSIAMTISTDYFVSQFFNPDINQLHTRNAERILKGCLINGGTYIKIGQGLVSLSHLLPKEFITTLAKLQDKCLTRSHNEVEQLFLEEFGQEPDSIYQSFDKEPIATASLAQVFVAMTKEGRKVAVKVQYNDLQERFVSDVATINFLLKLGRLVHPSFDFAWILEDLTESLAQELDFRNEGLNSERCAEELRHLSYIHVPEVLWDLSSDRVLVTEYVEGVKIDNKEKLIEEGHRIIDVDNKMFRTFGEQIFQTGFVHADPHPGNILVRKHRGETQLVLLDHGLYQSISWNERVALSHFWKALVLQNHSQMQKYSRELGVEDYKKLAEILTQRPLTKDFKLATKMTQEELDYFHEVAANRLDIITNTLKEMPRSLLFVVRNLNTLRAISHDHGDVVDRYTILARSATKYAFRSKDKFLKKLLAFPTLLSFEYHLLVNRLWIWFITNYLIILNKIGRSPDTSQIIAQIN